MMQSKNNITIKVRAPARLHLGFLDLHGGLGRLFGSLGIGLNDIYTELDVRCSNEPEYIGESALRAQKYTERMLAHLNIRSSVRLQIHKAIPEHAGLGSGTQMALAVGSAISKLFDADLSLADIARILDRGNRSGIGIGAFERGGFIVDAGRSSTTEVPPVISQLYFPDSWRFVLVLDKKRQGVHGQEEKKAFGTLAKMDESISANLCRLLVMQVLPAIAEQDCGLFGSAVTTIQASMGEYFKSIQSGIYTSAEVGEVLTRLHTMGASGVGQSSWGPTGFAIYASETDAYQALKEIRSNWQSDSNLELMICKAHNEPASVITTKHDYDNSAEMLEQV
jgi:beta-ribofuranosylaminobenzene 5'-phosphate synthase